jgi:hypothetical protein
MGSAGVDARATGIGLAAALATIPLSGWLLWFVLTVVGSKQAAAERSSSRCLWGLRLADSSPDG